MNWARAARAAGCLTAICLVALTVVRLQAASSAPLTSELPNAATTQTAIKGAHIEGDPIGFQTFGDLWMPTWADDGRLFLSWGDGSGLAVGYPTGYPAYQSSGQVEVTFCEGGQPQPEDEGYFPCGLWCAMNPCGPGQSHPLAALTDAGVLSATGPVPNLENLSIASIDVPDGDPFILSSGPPAIDISDARNDKPSSLLFYDGRLYLAGHSPAGSPIYGYIAYSDDYGQTWTEVADSPWGESSNFRVLMFVNMGQAYSLNQDGYVYAFGVGTEAAWNSATVYLARVPRDQITDYAAYEYFSGMGNSGPGWSSEQSAAVAVDGLRATGQSSAMFHEGSGRYLFLTTDAGPPNRYGALYEAPQPWGPWTLVSHLCFTPECDNGTTNPAWTDGKYIAGLIPKGAGPDYVYFTVAGGDQHYQLQIGKLVLEAETTPPGNGFEAFAPGLAKNQH